MKGLKAAADQVFSVSWQCFWVHFMRNLGACVCLRPANETSIRRLIDAGLLEQNEE